MLNGGGKNFNLDSNFTNNRSNFKIYRRTLSSEDFHLPSSSYPTPIEYKLVATRTRTLYSTLVDVRPQRTIHVTNRCHRSCKATHCGLSTVLPLAASSFTAVLDKPPITATLPVTSFSTVTGNHRTISAANGNHQNLHSVNSYRQTPDLASASLLAALDSLDDLIKETLDHPDNIMEGRSSGQWKSSFQSTRSVFKNHDIQPHQLKLGGMSSANSMNSIEIIVDNNDEFESTDSNLNKTDKNLLGRSSPSRGRSPLKTSVVRSRSAHSVDAMFLTNGINEGSSNLYPDRRTSYDDSVRKSNSRSKSPMDSNNPAGLMSSFWTNAVSQPKYDFFMKSSINVAATKSAENNRIKIFDENSRFDKLFESFVSKQPPAPKSFDKKTKTSRSKFESHHRIPASNEASFIELDSIIEDMKATGKQLEAGRSSASPGIGDDSQALKLIDNVQSFLQNNINSLSSSTKFPEMETSTSSSLEGRSPERRKSSSSPDQDLPSPHGHHHYHLRTKHHNTIREMFQMNEKFPRTKMWHSLATGSVAERVQQFDKDKEKSHYENASQIVKPSSNNAPAVLDSLRTALAEASGQVNEHSSAHY